MEEICRNINKVIDEEFESLEEYKFGEDFIFDCCENSPEEKDRNNQHYFINGHDRIDYCDQCIGSFKEKFTYIDRRDKTEEEKPRKWRCCFCHIRNPNFDFVYDSYTSQHVPAGELLGGGCEWYYYKDKHLDCCMKCWKTLSSENMFNCFLYDTNKQYFTSLRGYIPLVFPKSDYLDPSKTFDPTPLLEGNEYFSLKQPFTVLYGLVETPGFDIMKDNLFEWVPITNPEETSFCGACVTLFTQITDPKFPIAGLICDNHGRLSLMKYKNIFLENILDEYSIWKRNKLSEEERQNLRKEWKDEFSIPDEIVAKICDNFPSSFHFSKGYGVYFG